MALKTFRPLTPSARFKALPSFDEITKKKPEKSLVTTRKRTGGRNNQGRLTCRHIGGGHKRKLRLVDFKRRKHGMIADVIAIEYDPNRTARIALLQYSDGEKAYILAPVGLGVGDKVSAGPGSELVGVLRPAGMVPAEFFRMSCGSARVPVTPKVARVGPAARRRTVLGRGPVTTKPTIIERGPEPPMPRVERLASCVAGARVAGVVVSVTVGLVSVWSGVMAWK